MFSMEWFRIYRGAKFFGFSKGRLFRMTFDDIFMTKTFYRMSNTNFENFTSIRPRVAEKMNFKNANTYIRHTYVTDCFTPFSLRERRVTASPQFTNLVSDQVNPP